KRFCASLLMSVRSSTLGSKDDGGDNSSMRSWPWPAAISADNRVGRSARSTWSTDTFTPVWRPQSLAKGSNHWSCLGTKWLHCRMRRSPASCFGGCLNTVVGAPAAALGAVVVPFVPPQAAATTRPPVTPRNFRREIVHSRGSPIATPITRRCCPLPTRATGERTVARRYSALLDYRLERERSTPGGCQAEADLEASYSSTERFETRMSPLGSGRP